MPEPEEAADASTDQRLAEILDGFGSDLRAGRDPHPERLLDRHPEMAAELSDCLQAFAAMEELRSELLSSEKTPASVPPQSLGEYRIAREIGRGGMGVVYEATHASLQRRVALKMIKSGSLAEERDLEMFRKEARAAALLQHPNIVQLFELGEQHGQPYLVLEFVEGGSLESRLAKAPMPPLEAASLLATIAHALHYAHSRGIVHRDLKPANVLLDLATASSSAGSRRPVPKVADFGLAKVLQGDSQTHSRTIKGTPSYMAPEQVTGGQVCPATDVYALGAILYEMLTGRPPFRSATPWDTLTQVASLEPVSPIRLQPTVPRDLETICLKCLRKEPSQRYTSAEELALDLERFLRHEPIRARPVGMVERSWRWMRRNPVVATLLTASAALACLVIVLLAVRLADERAARERILAESVFTANHLANTILVELWRSAEAVDQVASDPELLKRLKGDRRRLRPLTPVDSASPRFELPREERTLQTFLEQLHKEKAGAFHSWHVVDDQGILIADVPAPARSVFGVSFEGRDYFLGAQRHVGVMGRARVHVSRAYQSSNDDLFKITLSAVVYDDDRQSPVGVVCATLPTGFLDLTDAEHTAVLVGRKDANDPHQKPSTTDASDEYMILVHPAYGELAPFGKGRNAVLMPATTLPLAPRRVANQDEFVKTARSADDAAKQRHDSYEDPLGKFEPSKYGGRWLAGFAQVGNTDMVVIVQRRLEGGNATWHWMMLGGTLLTGLLVLAIWRIRRRALKVRVSTLSAPTIDFTPTPQI